MKFLLFSLLLIVPFSSLHTADNTAPLALIYKGPGSCEASFNSTGCSEAAAAVAQQAGFKTIYVGPNENPKELFKTASIWIQPGGRARIQQEVMGQNLKDMIIDFVSNGGGYVGFCAGGFLASETFGWDTEVGPYEAKGLGFIKGKSHYYNFYDSELSQSKLAKIISTTWENKKRMVYWELGPYFTKENISGLNAEIIAQYPPLSKNNNEYIMTLRSQYKKGRVFITAVHPEAPQDWRDYYKIKDTDGLDFELAKSMILWSAKKNSNSTLFGLF